MRRVFYSRYLREEKKKKKKTGMKFPLSVIEYILFANLLIL